MDSITHSDFNFTVSIRSCTVGTDQTEVPLSFKKVIDKLFGQRQKGEKGQPADDAIKQEKKAAKKDKKNKEQQKASSNAAMNEDEKQDKNDDAAGDAAESAPQSVDLPPPMATFEATPFAPKLMSALTSAFPGPSPIQAQVPASLFVCLLPMKTSIILMQCPFSSSLVPSFQFDFLSFTPLLLWFDI